eukprot:806517_1
MLSVPILDIIGRIIRKLSIVFEFDHPEPLLICLQHQNSIHVLQLHDGYNDLNHVIINQLSAHYNDSIRDLKPVIIQTNHVIIESTAVGTNTRAKTEHVHFKCDTNH